MSSCDYYQELLSSFVDDELSEPQKTELESHIKTCENCKKLHELLCVGSELLSGELIEPPSSLSADIMAEIRAAAPAASAAKRPRRWLRPLALAACAALVVLVSGRIRLPDGAGGAAPRSVGSVQNGEPADKPEVASTDEPQFTYTDPAAVPQLDDDAPATTAQPFGEVDGVFEDERQQSGGLAYDPGAESGIQLLGITQISLLSGNTENSGEEPLLTFTDEASLLFIMSLLEFHEPGEAADVSGEPFFVLDVTSDENGTYSVSVWIIEGRIYCMSELDEALYVAAGDAGDLFAFIAAA